MACRHDSELPSFRSSADRGRASIPAPLPGVSSEVWGRFVACEPRTLWPLPTHIVSWFVSLYASCFALAAVGFSTCSTHIEGPFAAVHRRACGPVKLIRPVRLEPAVELVQPRADVPAVPAAELPAAPAAQATVPVAPLLPRPACQRVLSCRDLSTPALPRQQPIDRCLWFLSCNCGADFET